MRAPAVLRQPALETDSTRLSLMGACGGMKQREASLGFFIAQKSGERCRLDFPENRWLRVFQAQGNSLLEMALKDANLRVETRDKHCQ